MRTSAVVTPERPAIADPPGRAHRVGAHAVTHPELEDARERARRRRADDEALQDAEPRMRLHDAHQPEHRLAGHQAVRVEGQHEFAVAPEGLAEVAHVAGLEAGVLVAPAVDDRVRIGRRRAPGGDRRLLGRRHLPVRGVAEDEIGEGGAKARPVDAGLHRREPRHGAGRVLVAEGHQDRGAGADRLAARRRPRRRARQPEGRPPGRAGARGRGARSRSRAPSTASPRESRRIAPRRGARSRPRRGSRPWPRRGPHR